MTESDTIYHVSYIKFKSYNEKFQFAPFIPYRWPKSAEITEFQDIQMQWKEWGRNTDWKDEGFYAAFKVSQ